jgi:hypothetical protein
MATVRIELDDGSVYTGTVTRAQTTPPPQNPVGPTSPTVPVTPPVSPSVNRIGTSANPEFTSDLRARGASLPSYSLGVDQELAIAIPRDTALSLLSIFQPTAGMCIAISDKPWDFPAAGVAAFQNPLAHTVGSQIETQKSVKATPTNLPGVPGGVVYFNARWTVYTGFGPGAPTKNYLKEMGLTVGKFEFRRDS